MAETLPEPALEPLPEAAFEAADDEAMPDEVAPHEALPEDVPPAEIPAEETAAEPVAEDTEEHDVLEPPTEPSAADAPITVGRMFADAIRRAGVRWAFTVPGESFLGLLEGLEAVGINVVATRHEGAAAFMAEAHAQLTGRPAAAHRHARRRRSEPRDRHPHGLRRLEPDVRLRRPGRAQRPRP